MHLHSAGRSWDIWAICLSTACILHCLAPMLLLAFLPNVLLLTGGHEVHLFLVLLAVPITLFVVWNERTGERNAVVFRTFAIIGLALLVLAVTVIDSEFLETALTLAGGATLAGAHLWRWRRSRTAQAMNQRFNSRTVCDTD